MGRTGVACPQHSPPRIVPQRGQVSEYTSKPPSSEHWAVLHEDVAWSYFANDAGHLSPHAGAGAVNACSLSGGADVLTREASRHHVNTASPRSSVKRSHVIPDRKRGQASVVLTGNENTRGVGVPLDGTYSAPSEEMTSEQATPSAREKSQLIEHVGLSLVTS